MTLGQAEIEKVQTCSSLTALENTASKTLSSLESEAMLAVVKTRPETRRCSLPNHLDLDARRRLNEKQHIFIHTTTLRILLISTLPIPPHLWFSICVSLQPSNQHFTQPPYPLTSKPTHPTKHHAHTSSPPFLKTHPTHSFKPFASLQALGPNSLAQGTDKYLRSTCTVHS